MARRGVHFGKLGGLWYFSKYGDTPLCKHTKVHAVQDNKVNAMLDLSLNPIDLTASFDRIATTLLEEYYLCTPTQRYQLTELEFYYNTPDRQADPFAHVHKGFIPSGQWRLHGAGLDLVLAEEGHYYGGILLRGMEAVNAAGTPLKGGCIDGPWLLAECCIHQLGQALSSQQGFYLAPRHTAVSRPFVCSPRVGLSLRSETLAYWGKPWRYTTLPLTTKKYRHLLYLELWHQGHPAAQQLGLQASTCANYHRYYQEGQQAAKLNTKPAGKSVQKLCQWLGYYHKHY